LCLLFDQNVPAPLARHIVNHEVSLADDLGWGDLTNGKLIDVAEAADFDVLVTADRNIRHQQNLFGRKIALVVLSTKHWPVIKGHLLEITAAIERAAKGTYTEVVLQKPPLKRRLRPKLL